MSTSVLDYKNPFKILQQFYPTVHVTNHLISQIFSYVPLFMFIPAKEENLISKYLNVYLLKNFICMRISYMLNKNLSSLNLIFKDNLYWNIRIQNSYQTLVYHLYKNIKNITIREHAEPIKKLILQENLLTLPSQKIIPDSRYFQVYTTKKMSNTKPKSV